jgi:hypothetical protein
VPARSATFAVLSCTAATADELQVDAAGCSRLLELLGLVPDSRKRRGVRHSVAVVLAIAAAAVLAGSWSILAIGEWAAEAPRVVLAALRARRHPVPAGSELGMWTPSGGCCAWWTRMCRPKSENRAEPLRRLRISLR